jgi:hypothetical protein
MQSLPHSEQVEALRLALEILDRLSLIRAKRGECVSGRDENRPMR